MKTSGAKRRMCWLERPCLVPSRSGEKGSPTVKAQMYSSARPHMISCARAETNPTRADHNCIVVCLSVATNQKYWEK